jgi:hypothetical protein
LVSPDPTQRITEAFFAAPILADLFGDGKLEIIDGAGQHFNNPAIQGFSPTAQAAGNRVYAWNGEGQLLPGFPYHTTSDDTQTHQTFVSDAAGDLFGNGQMEIVHVDLGGLVHVILPNGQAAPGWAGGKPILPTGFTAGPGTEAFASPIIADINGDGKPDVIVADSFALTAYDASGNQLWQVTTPITAGTSIPDSILGAAGAVGSLNGAGDLELASLSFAATNPNAPAHMSVYSLPATSLTPPWPMIRRSAAGVAVQNSLVYDAGLTRAMYGAFMGRSPTGPELVAAAFGLQQNSFTATNLATFLDTSTGARAYQVNQTFNRYLGRAPSAIELNAATSALGSIRIVTLAQVLVDEGEFISKATSLTNLVQRLYSTILGRSPSPQELAAGLTSLNGGKNYAQYAASLLNSTEAADHNAIPFFLASGGPIEPDSVVVFSTDIANGVREETAYAHIMATSGQYASGNYLATWIRAVYRDALDRDASPSEVASVYGALSSGAVSLANLATFLLTGPEGRAAFVQEQFQRYLGRPASPTEVAQNAGYVSRESLTMNILALPEYFLKAGGNNTLFVQAAYRDITKIPSIDPGTLNLLVGKLNSGTSRQAVAKILLDIQIPIDDYFRYLPDPSMGVLSTGALSPSAPGQPINPNPAKVAAFSAALQAGAPEEVLIAGLMTTPQYILSTTYNKGIFRSRGIWN